MEMDIDGGGNNISKTFHRRFLIFVFRECGTPLCVGRGEAPKRSAVFSRVLLPVLRKSVYTPSGKRQNITYMSPNGAATGIDYHRRLFSLSFVPIE